MGRIEAFARVVNTLKKVGYKTPIGDEANDELPRHYPDRDKKIGDTKEKVFASLSGRNRLSQAWREKALNDEAYKEFLAQQQQQQQQEPPGEPEQAAVLSQAASDDLPCSSEADIRSRRSQRGSVTSYTVDLYGSSDRCGSGFGSGSFTRSITTGAVSGNTSAGFGCSSPFGTEAARHVSCSGSGPSGSGGGGCNGGGAAAAAAAAGGRLPQLSPLGDVARARSSLDLDLRRAGAGLAGFPPGPRAVDQGGDSDDGDGGDSDGGGDGRGSSGSPFGCSHGSSASRPISAFLRNGVPASPSSRPCTAASSGGGGAGNTALRLPSLLPSSQSSALLEGGTPGLAAVGGGAGSGGSSAGGGGGGLSSRILAATASTGGIAVGGAAGSSGGGGALMPSLSRQSTPSGAAAFASVRQQRQQAGAADEPSGRLSPAPPLSGEPPPGAPRRRQVSVTGIVQVAPVAAAASLSAAGGGGARRPSLVCRSRATSSRALGPLDDDGVGVGGGGGAAAVGRGMSRRGSLAQHGAREDGIALDIMEDVGRWFDAGDLLYCNADSPEEMDTILEQLSRVAAQQPGGGGGGGGPPTHGSAAGSRAVSRTTSGNDYVHYVAEVSLAGLSAAAGGGAARRGGGGGSEGAAGGGGGGGGRGSDSLLPRLPTPTAVASAASAISGPSVRQPSSRRRSCHVPELEYARMLAEAAPGGGGDGGGGGGGRFASQSQRRSSQLLIQAAGRRASMLAVSQQ